jgi:MoaA/NifB/PqqE/SkfB family radical SAM enzyme
MVQRLSSISNFAVTSKCNGKCTMCNIWKTEPTDDPTIEQIKGFFEKNQAFLRDLKFIQLTGGEPFLRDDLPEIAKVVNDTAPKCMIWLPTNGLLPEKIYQATSRMMEMIEDPKIGVTVSLDGEGEMHDIQRGIDGSYKKAIETLRLLSSLKKKHDLSLSTGFTLTQDNYKQATLIQKISYRYGADFSFRPLNISEHYYQNMGKNGEFTDDIPQYLDAIAYTLKREKGVIRSLTNLAYVQGAKEFISGKRKMACSAADESVFINTMGDVYPCIVMNYKLGNIYEDGLREILQSTRSNEARETIKKLECPTCWLECEAYRDIKKDWGRLLNALIRGLKPSS